MADRPLELNIENFVDPVTGDPVSLGDVYIGNKDTDPEVLGNRKVVTVVEESGNEVPITQNMQPLTLSAGGVVVYNGSPVVVLVDGVYSIKVNNSLGAQVYYVPRANEFLEQTVDTGVLVLNGSFENETVNIGVPDDWTVTETATGTIETDTVERKHGAQSLKFTSVDVTGAGNAKNSARFPCGEGRSVFVAFDLLSTSANSRTLVEITWYNAAGSPFATSTVLDEGSANPLIGFNRIETLMSPPAGAVSAELVLQGMMSGGTTMVGSTWFDDIVVWNGYDFVFTGHVLHSGTRVVTTSGGAALFPDLPEWVKDITVQLENVSLAGLAEIDLLVGHSGGVFPGSGYLSTNVHFTTGANAFQAASTNLQVCEGLAALVAVSGHCLLTRDTNSNLWTYSSTIGATVFGNDHWQSAGNIDLGATPLDAVRLQTSSTFDLGSITLTYNG